MVSLTDPYTLIFIGFSVIAAYTSLRSLEDENIVYSVMNFAVFLVSVAMLLFLINASFLGVFILAEFVGTAIVLALFTVMIGYTEISERGQIDWRVTVASAILVTVGGGAVALLAASGYGTEPIMAPADTQLAPLSQSIFEEFGVAATLMGFFMAIVVLGGVVIASEPEGILKRTPQILLFGEGVWLAVSIAFLGIGLYGVMSKRNVLKLLFAAEITTAAGILGGVSVAMAKGYTVIAQSIGIFVTAVSTLELIIAIAIIYAVHKELKTVDLTELATLRG